MIFGYARVSKAEGQDTAAQVAALKAAGAETIFEDAASGGRFDRPSLQKLLDTVGLGDVVIVWKLDRLSRSLMDLLRIMDRLDKAGDLPPEAPSFITRVCGFGFHIRRFRFGQARRARSPQIAQALDALQRVFGCPEMSAA